MSMTSSGEEMALDASIEEDLSPEGLPHLLQAAKDADVAAFKRMLEDGEDVLQKDDDDRTALHWAAQSGCVPIIMSGITRGLMWHVNAKSRHGLSPLHVACLAGYARTVHVLLSIGADMTSKTQEGYTPLLCAAGNGHNDVARILVGAGCDANHNLQHIGVNALHIAAWTDQPDVLDDLLDLGADMAKKSKTGKTAMDFAVDQNHTDCVNVLRKHEDKAQVGVKDKLQEQEDFFRAKLNFLADKIHKYYDNRLKEEIAYFEEQLQELHDKDVVVINKLKSQIDQLLKTELDDDDDEDVDEYNGGHGTNGQHNGGGVGSTDVNMNESMQPTRGASEGLKVSLRRRRRSSQFAHRPRRFSITASHDHVESSDDEQGHRDPRRRRYERQISMDSHRQPKRPGSAKTKSMMELVDDASKRTTSVNFVKSPNSMLPVERPDSNLNNPKPSMGVPTIRLLQPKKPAHPRSSTPSKSMSFTPSNSSMSPSPPPPSPVDAPAPSFVSSAVSPAPYSTTDSVFNADSNNDNCSGSNALLPQPTVTKSRRSSIAEFLRPHFKSKSQDDGGGGGSDGGGGGQKSRRRSFVAGLRSTAGIGPSSNEHGTTSSSQPRKPRKKGTFSLFSGAFALPGIPTATTTEGSKKAEGAE